MNYLTVSIAGALDPARKAEIDEAVAHRSGTITWRTDSAVNRSYASIASASPIGSGDIPPAAGDVIYDGAIIALALFPTVAEALPVVVEALQGGGRPEGVLACHAVAGGLVIEWDPQRSPVEVVMGVVDVELRRFAAGRSAELLSPLPPEVIASVAARGLQTPQMTTQRILELIVSR